MIKSMFIQTKAVWPNSRQILRGLSCLLSLALLLQGAVFSTAVYAQKRQKPTGQTKVGGKADEGQERNNGRTFFPERRQIGILGSINVQGLSDQLGLAPLTSAPTELRPIHVPKESGQLNAGVPIRRPDEENTASAPTALGPAPTVTSPPPTRGFRGDGLLSGSIPPDTHGAVGDNHVITITNEKVLIHTREGVITSTVTLNSFWSSTVGLPNPSTFDPKVFYDRFNDRFIMVTQANPQLLNSATLIATSQTADPNGTWDRYFIDADAAATAGGGKWADYPSVGFNSQWITVQVNLFGFGSVAGYQGPAIYVLNKADAYNGAPATFSAFEGSFATCLGLPAAAQPLELGCGFTMVPHVAEDNVSTTQYIVEDWDSQAAQLRLTTMTGTAAAPILAVGTQFPQSPNSWRFNASLISGTGGYVPQRQQNIYLPSGTRPTANDSRLQNAVFRGNTLWTVHHVMLAAAATLAGTAVGGGANPDIRTGIQWWQIDPTIVNSIVGTLPLQRGVIQDPLADNCHNGSGGTRAGCTTATQVGEFYTFPNISVNLNNDVLIGYSRFSPLSLAKGAYSFRKSTDAPNTIRDSQVIREGVGNYNIGAGSPFNVRWGDYSVTQTDPLNDKDFWISQEFADYQREIFGPGGFAGVWATWWALINPDQTTSYSGSLLISEFRLRGPAGARDEYIELYNAGSTPVTVSTTDNSDGWAVAFNNGTTTTALAVVPNGTTIQPGAHYLVANNVAATGIPPYSLNTYPNTAIRPSDADAMYTPDLADNGGVAIFRTGTVANFSPATRIDSVGFATMPAGLFKEGTGIPNITGAPTSNIAFVRKLVSGVIQDTGDNAADFTFVSTTAEVLGVPSRLGSPGPENVDSPLNYNALVFMGLLDPAVAPQAAPNRVRDLTPDPGNNSTNGTLTFRRTLQNNSPNPIKRLRFRIYDMTSFPLIGPGIADVRARTSPGPVVIAITGPNPACPANSCTVQALTLESPPAQTMGGALNSSLSAGTITLTNQIAPGGRLNLQFLLGVQTDGYFRFFVNVEALP